METKRIYLKHLIKDHHAQGTSSKKELEEAVQEAAGLLKQGEVVAFPTETVYGLGAKAWSGEACAKIFAVKGRPADNPLIVHVSSIEEAKGLVSDWPKEAAICAGSFWPGPLTIVLPKSERIPEQVSAGLDTVAIRFPAHPVAVALIKASGFPIAAPSANISGKPSPTEGEHVWQDLNGKIPLLLDAGRCEIGLESTVLDLSGQIPVILRPGGITWEQLSGCLGKVEIDQGAADKPGQLMPPRSPGVKYRHYAPQGKLILLEENFFAKMKMIESSLSLAKIGRKIALICFQETFFELPERVKAGLDLVFILGEREKPEEAAGRLFAGLRLCDRQGMDLILAEGMSNIGIGAAFMNRLKKAAGKGDMN